MQGFYSPDESKIWINLGSKGCWGQVVGAVMCFIMGTIGGLLSVMVWGAVLLFLPIGFLGRDLIGAFLNVAHYVSSGAWIVGLFGLIPGMLIGLAFAVLGKRAWGKVMLLALALGYGVELIYGYPTNFLGIVFYITSPIQAVWFAFVGAMFVKSRFGLLPSEESVLEVNNNMKL